MKKVKPLIPLFKQFIKESESGKRLKKNGERITKSSIDNYTYVLRNLILYSEETQTELRVCDILKLTKKELLSEKNYWKKFYKNFTEFLYKRGCYDNYVGATIKIIRVFFNYLKLEKDIYTGDFHKQFYVRKEEIDILVLSPEQLKFLIHDKEFEEKLTPGLRKIKDIFVFGCTTGLRYSDIFLLTNKNLEQSGEDWYLRLKSKKTKTSSSIKLPNYAVLIVQRYLSKNTKKSLFGGITLFNFNKSLKQIGELAEFTTPIEISREKQGVAKQIKSTKDSKDRFCDKMSSHMMRRTAITTLLILGMPEHLVRKISGHSTASSSFNRYVHYAQVYIDREIDKVHSKLESY
ncbi:tyrosine-type recombinase/integrase [Flavobacterium sp. UBA7682]|uniref:tyrosine-type recombinase/integrase n=1 Tax=Flavobacterium sp. UBA7682 TaxID=1946560 RepID=UPI0025BFC4C7|nr:tyrosine-type recombinase/integrase [Flavobacterium sp. UBA7682]